MICAVAIGWAGPEITNNKTLNIPHFCLLVMGLTCFLLPDLAIEFAF